jgi:predicted PolB exonuclease-like 3'-5' exonuclease
MGTAFLIFDTESVPDGQLLRQVKYPDADMAPEDAIARAQAEARELSREGSDFLPVSFQVPVAVCVLRVAADFTLQALACLDAPQYRTEEMVRKFWLGVARYNRARLVTFNGRCFDLPLLELAAFRQGCPARDYFSSSRNRFQGNHVDLCDWLSNYGACRLTGGLNLLAKLLGKPGKMDIAGDQVYAMYREGRLREINDYCMFDTLDTYFVFLRTRVLLGEMTTEEEHFLIDKARCWLEDKSAELPALRQYIDNWTG